MKDGNEIEIYYRFSKLDNIHQYCIVSRQSEIAYHNYWIFWLWYKMGASFTNKELKSFMILPYDLLWDENCKLIKEYKTVNRGTDLVVPAIRKHFNKLKTINYE